MNAIGLKGIALGVVLLLAMEFTGAQPPDVVQSDANGNTAMGGGALQSNTTGIYNTAGGSQPLLFNTTGSGNTAFGVQALIFNTTGTDNTAVGIASLQASTSADNNTAFGAYTLVYNTVGTGNNAVGVNALAFNTTGNNNTAVGVSALYQNSIGGENVAVGSWALTNNTTGSANTASGIGALSSNTTGENNTAIGSGALNLNTAGLYNTAIGGGALHDTTGSQNIGIGINAGGNLTSGSNNIDIANFGIAGESSTIRIGIAGHHTQTFVAGIWGNHVRHGASVVVGSDGQLGVEESSERYKADIAPMGARAAKLQQLRPVTYRLTADPSQQLQYGLIAEEVNKVYPELVVRDDAGNIEGVRYDRLAPILLGEVQRQQRELAAQAAQLGELKSQFAALLEINRAMQVVLPQVEDRNDTSAGKKEEVLGL